MHVVYTGPGVCSAGPSGFRYTANVPTWVTDAEAAVLIEDNPRFFRKWTPGEPVAPADVWVWLPMKADFYAAAKAALHWVIKAYPACRIRAWVHADHVDNPPEGVTIERGREPHQRFYREIDWRGGDINMFNAVRERFLGVEGMFLAAAGLTGINLPGAFDAPKVEANGPGRERAAEPAGRVSEAPSREVRTGRSGRSEPEPAAEPSGDASDD